MILKNNKKGMKTYPNKYQYLLINYGNQIQVLAMHAENDQWITMKCPATARLTYANRT